MNTINRLPCAFLPGFVGEARSTGMRQRAGPTLGNAADDQEPHRIPATQGATYLF